MARVAAAAVRPALRPKLYAGLQLQRRVRPSHAGVISCHPVYFSRDSLYKTNRAASELLYGPWLVRPQHERPRAPRPRAVRAVREESTVAPTGHRRDRRHCPVRAGPGGALLIEIESLPMANRNFA